MKDHRGRLHVDAHRRRAGWPRSVLEAILEPGVDVLDELKQFWIGIFVHDAGFPFGFIIIRFRNRSLVPALAIRL